MLFPLSFTLSCATLSCLFVPLSFLIVICSMKLVISPLSLRVTFLVDLVFSAPSCTTHRDSEFGTSVLPPALLPRVLQLSCVLAAPMILRPCPSRSFLHPQCRHGAHHVSLPCFSAIARFSAFSSTPLALVLHLSNVGLLSTCPVAAFPFPSPPFLLLQAYTFANKVSVSMSIFSL